MSFLLQQSLLKEVLLLHAGKGRGSAADARVLQFNGHLCLLSSSVNGNLTQNASQIFFALFRTRSYAFFFFLNVARPLSAGTGQRLMYRAYHHSRSSLICACHTPLNSIKIGATDIGADMYIDRHLRQLMKKKKLRVVE